MTLAWVGLPLVLGWRTCLPTQKMQETWVWSLDREDPLEEGMQLTSAFCLENPLDRGGWWATVHGVAKRQTQLKQLRIHACLTWIFHLCLLWSQLLQQSSPNFSLCFKQGLCRENGNVWVLWRLHISGNMPSFLLQSFGQSNSYSKF